LIILGAIGSVFSDDGENNNDSQNVVQASNEPALFDESNQSKESEEPENNSSEIPSDESEPENENPLGFDVMLVIHTEMMSQETGDWQKLQKI